MSVQMAIERLCVVIKHYEELKGRTTSDGKYWCEEFLADLKLIKKELKASSASSDRRKNA